MKYILVLLTLSLSASIYLLFFNDYTFLPPQPQPNFVHLKEGKFFLNDQKFHPITVNYIVGLHGDGKEIWVAPALDYSIQKEDVYINKDVSLKKFKTHMQLIKEMGFNAVRLVRVGEVCIDEVKDGELSINVNISNQHDTIMLSNNNENYQKYFHALEEMFNIVNEAGLKTIFLTRMSPNYVSSEKHLMKLCLHFKDNSAILAYDLFNEPLYFDKPEKKKEEVYKIVKNWQKIIKTYAPYHLSTIGLEGIREVFRWDPNILAVDFISYHPYEYEPEQVRNEIYWYGKYTKKPWIIGETAIPADGDSINFEIQKEFAAKTIRQTFNCGAIGYSWWQFKDVSWNSFHADFMGIVTHQDELKPIVKEFKSFVYNSKKDSCFCLPNYYNYSQSNAFKLTGKIVNGNNYPIHGAVVLAWNRDWTHSYHTITQQDGSFKLLGSYPFYHWMASATEYTTVRGDLNPDTSVVKSGEIPSMVIGELKLQKLAW